MAGDVAKLRRSLSPMSITIRSTAFEAGRPIPGRHTEDGEDLSPELAWAGIPEGTKELALIVDDPDAPTPEPWVHWVIYKIPADLPGLMEGVAYAEAPAAPDGALQGKNTWGTIGYRGPAPPKGHGTHHYFFKLYALDGTLDVPPGLDKNALLAAMEGKILAQGELIGTYER
jgi:Raf kinase inhibitor-like YbhB/YbcL family protein